MNISLSFMTVNWIHLDFLNLWRASFHIFWTLFIGQSVNWETSVAGRRVLLVEFLCRCKIKPLITSSICLSSISPWPSELSTRSHGLHLACWKVLTCHRVVFISGGWGWWVLCMKSEKLQRSKKKKKKFLLLMKTMWRDWKLVVVFVF